MANPNTAFRYGAKRWALEKEELFSGDDKKSRAEAMVVKLKKSYAKVSLVAPIKGRNAYVVRAYSDMKK